MNKHARRTALVAGMCLSLTWMNSPQALAANDFYAAQQTKSISGVVVDASGIPVIGANVLEKGTTNGVITDLDGNFTLNVNPGATLVISFIGYVSQEIVVGEQNTYNITLKEDTEVLDEVVVVGYGVQKKKLVTGATVEVKGEDIAKRNTINALGALQNQSPGVNIQAVSGKPGDGYKISIRGAGTNSSTNPLYIIDGVAGGDINAALLKQPVGALRAVFGTFRLRTIVQIEDESRDVEDALADVPHGDFGVGHFKLSENRLPEHGAPVKARFHLRQMQNVCVR